MELQPRREVPVIIADGEFAVKSIGNFFQLMDLLRQSQELAQNQYGEKALAVYRLRGGAS